MPAGRRASRTVSASASSCGNATSGGSSRSRTELAELDGRAFVAELERRFGDRGESRRGVHLLTLHGAKGLEFDAVFVAHVEARELPARQAKPRRR